MRVLIELLIKKGPSTFVVKIEDPDDNQNPDYTKQVTTADLKPVYARER